MRVAIIGSGLGGLLTAALLRKRGVDDVVRYERAREDGGRARSPLLGGLPVNLGPRALYRGGPLARALATLGVRPTGFAPPSSGALAIFEGALAPLPSSLGELLAAPADRGLRLAARDKRALAAALARIAVGNLAADGLSMGAWLDRHAATEKARAIVALLVRTATYSADPAQDAALALAQTRRAFLRGVIYVDGGWRSITDALAPLAGPSIVQAVDDDHAHVDADVIVDARSTPERARQQGPGGAPASVGGPPVIASCLDVVLERLPRPAHRIALGVDEPSYVSVHSRLQANSGSPSSSSSTSASTSAQGEGAHPGERRQIVHAMIYGGAPRASLERALDLVQPGWRDVAVASRYLSRMIVSSALPLPGHPRAAQTPDAGARTLLVGDHVDSGALLADGVAASALSAVDAICSRRSLRANDRSATAA